MNNYPCYELPGNGKVCGFLGDGTGWNPFGTGMSQYVGWFQYNKEISPGSTARWKTNHYNFV